jgi:hypothetical protein
VKSEEATKYITKETKDYIHLLKEEVQRVYHNYKKNNTNYVSSPLDYFTEERLSKLIEAFNNRDLQKMGELNEKSEEAILTEKHNFHPRTLITYAICAFYTSSKHRLKREFKLEEKTFNFGKELLDTALTNSRKIRDSNEEEIRTIHNHLIIFKYLSDIYFLEKMKQIRKRIKEKDCQSPYEQINPKDAKILTAAYGNNIDEFIKHM